MKLFDRLARFVRACVAWLNGKTTEYDLQCQVDRLNSNSPLSSTQQNLHQRESIVSWIDCCPRRDLDKGCESCAEQACLDLQLQSWRVGQVSFRHNGVRSSGKYVHECASFN